jgi:hypothetical protein
VVSCRILIEMKTQGLWMMSNEHLDSQILA